MAKLNYMPDPLNASEMTCVVSCGKIAFILPIKAVQRLAITIGGAAF